MAKIVIKDGQISSSAGINIPGSLSISGNTILGDNFTDTLTVNANATFNDDLTVQDTLSGTIGRFTTITGSAINTENLRSTNIINAESIIIKDGYDEYPYGHLTINSSGSLAENGAIVIINSDTNDPSINYGGLFKIGIDNSDNQNFKISYSELASYWDGQIIGGAYHGGNDALSISKQNGAIGIGTSPDSNQRLTVAGNIKITGSSNYVVSGAIARFTVVSSSFTGSGAGLYNLTASKINNFTNDVRAQFSAGTNITIVDGVISSTAAGGGGGTPGGVDTNIQFNSGSTFSGSNNLIYNYTTNTLSGTTAQFTNITTNTLTGSSINITGTLSASSAQSIIKSDQGISFRTRNNGTGSFTERMFISTNDSINVYSSINTTTLTASVVTANVVTASVTLTGSTALFATITGSTAQFTTITGSIVTGSTFLGTTARFTTITGSIVTGTIAIFSQITSSAIYTSGVYDTQQNSYIKYNSAGDNLLIFPGLRGVYVTGSVTASVTVTAQTGSFSLTTGSTAQFTVVTGSTVTGSTFLGTTAQFTSVTSAFTTTTQNITGTSSVASGVMYFISAATTAYTITLPTPIAGGILYLIRTDSTAYIITISGHINGTPSTTNTSWFPASTADRRVVLVSNGTSWYPIVAGTVT